MIKLLTPNCVAQYMDFVDRAFYYELVPDKNYLFSNDDEKASLDEKKEAASNYISNQLQTIYSLRDLSLALFILRNEYKKRVYDINVEEWSFKYIVINTFFFLVYKHSQNNIQSKIITSGSDYSTIEKIVRIIAAIMNNKSLFDASFYQADAIENYMYRMAEISSKSHDLHSFSISDLSVLHCIKKEKIDMQQIKQKALKDYSKCYITNKELKQSREWQSIIRSYPSEYSEDILKIPKQDFQRISSKIKQLLMTFSVKKFCGLISEESEFAFTFTHDNYYYVSLSVLDDTQEKIEKFISWGQYSRVSKCFFGIEVNSQIKNMYNRLLTYKIADLLLSNEYILPLKTQDGISTPCVEIGNYMSEYEKDSEIGDIDITFYSPYTSTLYVIEFKNYQMFLSQSNNFSNEISKVIRDNVEAKIKIRTEYVREHQDDFVSRVYSVPLNIKETKSILLTTKPCFYFFLNQPSGFDYYDWIEFEEKTNYHQF